MGRINAHSIGKYVTGTCLGTSRARGWNNLLAERWNHSEGDLGEVTPRDHEIIVMLEGRLRVRRRGDGLLQEHNAEAGTVWLCPSGIREDCIHLFGEIRESIHVFLPAQRAAATACEELGIDATHLRLDYAGGFRDPLIETIARTIADEMQRPDPLGNLLVDTLAAGLGLHLIRSYSSHARTPPAAGAGSLPPARLRRVLDLIESNLARNIALAELAREACLSPYHFARCFKAATGLPPHRYLLLRRIERAKAMMSGGNASLSEIAYACGFSSQAHFSTAFAKEAGVSPRRFQATARA